jgi:uncharacterized protein YrrD
MEGKMQFLKGTRLVTKDGQDAGTVDAVVLDPKTREVIYVVASQGFLSGTDKLLPIELIGDVTEDGIHLHADAHDISEQQDFLETQYVTVDDPAYAADYASDPALRVDSARPLYAYPTLGMVGGAPMGPAIGAAAGTTSGAYVVNIDRNLPEDAVVLREGVNVIADNGDHVGDVERIIADPTSEQVTHFVISRGLLLKERKLIPVEWVSEFGEEEIHLVVSPRFLDALPDYTVDA